MTALVVHAGQGRPSSSIGSFGRHPSGLAVVVGLHVALAAVLVLNSTLQRTPAVVDPRVDLLDATRPPAPEPPPLPRPHAPVLTVPSLPLPTLADPKPAESDPVLRGEPAARVDDGPVVRLDPGPAVRGEPDVRPAVVARRAVIDARAPGCQPDYPGPAARAGAQGVSRIRFTVDAGGRVVAAETLRSAGSTAAHRQLDRAAADALQRCPITPGVDADGHAVGATVDVDYVWTLGR